MSNSECEGAYMDATQAERAGVLRRYIESRKGHRGALEFAGCLALAAGFTEREVRHLRHLTNDGAPSAGWTDYPPFVLAPRAPEGEEVAG